MDAFDDLTLGDFACASGLSAQEIARAQRQGELFSCRLGDEPFDRYPAYQLLDEIRAQPLRRLISAFGPEGGVSLYMFMQSDGDLLGGITAVEVLCGRLVDDQPIAHAVAELLKRDHSDRLRAVLTAAESWRAVRKS